jgi:hypothetical protein
LRVNGRCSSCSSSLALSLGDREPSPMQMNLDYRPDNEVWQYLCARVDRTGKEVMTTETGQPPVIGADL